MYRNQRLLVAVRALPCQLCGAEDGTVCAAHMNLGKGMGIKGSDAAIWAACFRCHTEYDQGKAMDRDAKRRLAYEMVAKTYIALAERGLVKV